MNSAAVFYRPKCGRAFSSFQAIQTRHSAKEGVFLSFQLKPRYYFAYLVRQLFTTGSTNHMKTRALPEPSFITNHCCNLVTTTPAYLNLGTATSYATVPRTCNSIICLPRVTTLVVPHVLLTVPASKPEPPPDHRSTAVNSEQRRSTVVQILLDHQSTVVVNDDQR
ncbi:hypothetical protein Tco_1277223 [Tanacetum coccineum]